MEFIRSHNELLERLDGKEKSFLLLYREGSEMSLCALTNVEEGLKGIDDAGLYAANVNTVRDIHQNYGIDSVPALLIFSGKDLATVIKGCHENTYYRALGENNIYKADQNNEKKPARNVTVYSTPTCSWCNTLKTWLQKNSIRYTDIDVSRDQRAAADLVKRSGQQGVPQTDINGQIVVGFNQPRLKELLGI